MLQSKLFTRVTKEAPKDEVSFNGKILIQAGFVDKLSAGVFSFLPLGLRVLNKISNIIREEMDKIGGEEILMRAWCKKKIGLRPDAFFGGGGKKNPFLGTCF